MIRIGIICPSEIAFRRFMPALKKAEGEIEFAGIGYASPEEWFGDLSNISPERILEQQERERSKAQTFKLMLKLYFLILFSSFPLFNNVTNITQFSSIITVIH